MSNLVFAQEIPLQDTQEVDSAQIYYDLIADENYQAYYKPNVTGTIVGGVLTGLGVFFGVHLYTFLKIKILTD